MTKVSSFSEILHMICDVLHGFKRELRSSPDMASIGFPKRWGRRKEARTICTYMPANYICAHTCTGVYVPLLALHIYAICIPIFTNICIYVCIMYVSLMFSLQRGKEKWVQGKLVHQNKNGQMQNREAKKCD